MTASLVHALRRSVGAGPDSIAIVADGDSTSYGELWDLAGHYGRRFAATTGNGHPYILLAGELGVELVAAIYGAWQAGRVVCMLSNAPQEWPGCAALVGTRDVWVFGAAADRSRVATQAEHAGLVPCMFEPREHAAGRNAGQPDGATYDPQPDAPALVLFTSGTTGKPKGVVLSHANLAANTAAICRYLALTPADSVLTTLPAYYSYGSSVIHTHLAAGATIHVERSAAFPQRLLDRAIETGATGLPCVSATLATLVKRVQATGCRLPSLRYITQAGSAISRDLAGALAAAFPGQQVFLMYGQTEATARLTYLPPPELTRRAGSVGIPVDGVRLQIRSAAGDAAPPGVVGEIWATGPNVMLGYLGDPEATRSVLVDGWLRTGDLGFLDAEGYLFLEGRRSDMIKVGGQRVNPLEVEAVAGNWPHVAACAAVGADDEALGEVVWLYVVPEPGSEIDAKGLDQHLKVALARHKVPRKVLVIDALPLTASGKLKRTALRSS